MRKNNRERLSVAYIGDGRKAFIYATFFAEWWDERQERMLRACLVEGRRGITLILLPAVGVLGENFMVCNALIHWRKELCRRGWVEVQNIKCCQSCFFFSCHFSNLRLYRKSSNCDNLRKLIKSQCRQSQYIFSFHISILVTLISVKY